MPNYPRPKSSMPKRKRAKSSIPSSGAPTTTIAGRIQAGLLGIRSAHANPGNTIPRNPVLMDPANANVSGNVLMEGRARTLLSYEHIGGLEPELQRIREMIELPLRYPEVFERLGIDPPKGVLLHGPPGTGKTLIARTIAHQAEARFFSVSGPEIIHKFYGESEAHLRQIFDEATKRQPSIIFLDELDAIAPRRERVVGDVEKRVVAQLLALMDGLRKRKNVIVIGATNIPNALDPALRRPGRFDREISIPIPNRIGRQKILEIHSRGMPLAGDVDLCTLADITHGFVGADLQALCREAAMSRLQVIIRDIDSPMLGISSDRIAKLEIHMDDFLMALKGVEPSAIREVSIEIPDVHWEDVGGLSEVKERLVEMVEWPLRYSHLFSKAHVRRPKGILLAGPPGTGKTLLAKAIASESNVNFISIKGPALLSMYVGESERGVRDVFRKARQAAPCIIFFDEIDSVVPKRSLAAGESHVSERVLSQFLSEFDGVEEMKDVLVLGATNRLDMLDPAVLRPGRFDYIVQIPEPNEASRREIFTVHLRKKPLGSGIDIGDLAARTRGLSGAEIESVCNKAALCAIRRAVEAIEKGPSREADITIETEDMEFALAEVKPFK